MKTLSLFLIGAVFGLGIVISGMSNPAKVVNFFDIAGQWDPSLAFVMFSAMFTAMAGYYLVFMRRRPVFGGEFNLPASKVIDKPLVLGSAGFGIGWGIAGFCPGGAIPALAIGHVEPAIFVAAMIVGIVGARSLRNMRVRSTAAAA